MSEFVQDRAAERRLRILQAISSDKDEAMSETRIKAQLDAWAWRAPIEVVRQDMRYLETLGAIRILPAGDELIGILAQLGRQHLAFETDIEGVQRPKKKF